MGETTYALGLSSAEIQRLKNQAAMLRPIAERLLRSAGIGGGMRVLDLGCGQRGFASEYANALWPTSGDNEAARDQVTEPRRNDD
jgi:hypothetical protein